MKPIHLFGILAVCFLVLGASLVPDTRSLTLRGHSIRAEVVSTPHTRARGMAGRPALPEGEGMLFVFPNPTKGGFWMKGCVHPLDIAWLDASGHVVGFVTMPPPPSVGLLPVYSPHCAYSFAVELAPGTLAAWGVAVGDSVDGLPFEDKAP